MKSSRLFSVLTSSHCQACGRLSKLWSPLVPEYITAPRMHQDIANSDNHRCRNTSHNSAACWIYHVLSACYYKDNAQASVEEPNSLGAHSTEAHEQPKPSFGCSTLLFRILAHTRRAVRTGTFPGSNRRFKV